MCGVAICVIDKLRKIPFTFLSPHTGNPFLFNLFLVRASVIKCLALIVEMHCPKQKVWPLH